MAGTRGRAEQWQAMITCAQVGPHGRDGVHKPGHHLRAAAGADLDAVADDEGPRDVLPMPQILETMVFAGDRQHAVLEHAGKAGRSNRAPHQVQPRDDVAQ